MSKGAGHNPDENIWVFDEVFFNAYLGMIDIDARTAKCIDIGKRNAKMEYIKGIMHLDVKQLEIDDLNYGFTTEEKYDCIFCFETLEHIVNQLTLMESIKKALKPGGVVYMSFPSRNSWFWTQYHYHEVSRYRFEKWILEPLGMEITKHIRAIIPQPWWFYFTGFKPFLRFWNNFTNIYEIKIKEKG